MTDQRANTREALVRSVDLLAGLAGVLVVASLIVYTMGTVELWISFKRAGIPELRALALQDKQYLLQIGVRGLIPPAILGAAVGLLTARILTSANLFAPHSAVPDGISRLKRDIDAAGSANPSSANVEARIDLLTKLAATDYSKRLASAAVVIACSILILGPLLTPEFRSIGTLLGASWPFLFMTHWGRRTLFRKTADTADWAPRWPRFALVVAVFTVVAGLMPLLDGSPRIERVSIARSDKPENPTVGLLIAQGSEGWTVGVEKSLLFVPERVVTSARIEKPPEGAPAPSLAGAIGHWFFIYVALLVAAAAIAMWAVRRHYDPMRGDLEKELTRLE